MLQELARTSLIVAIVIINHPETRFPILQTRVGLVAVLTLLRRWRR
jgi:hypothetical protein